MLNYQSRVSMLDKRVRILTRFFPIEITAIILKFAKERKRKCIKRTTEIKLKIPKEKHMVKYYNHHYAVGNYFGQ